MGYNAYNESLSTTESGGRYTVVNSEGYGGKYQFGQARLDDFNRANKTGYTIGQIVGNSPWQRHTQERVQEWHNADIDKFASDYGLTQYIGQQVGGVTITPGGIRAMAHLGGKGGMKKYLETGGRYNPADSNGTSLRDYAKTHAGGAPENTQGTYNALARPPEQQKNALQPPEFIGPTNNAADFMTQPTNRLAQVGFDRNTNPFLQYLR